MIPVSRPQKEFIFSEHPHPAMIGGLGCVHPSTKIYTEYGLMRICDINRPMRVLSWNQKDQKFQLSLCGGGFPKERGNLCRISTQQGGFVGALHHRIFSCDHTYQRLEDLNQQDCVSVISKGQLPTILESCLKSSKKDDLHFSEINVNLMGDYANEARRYGQQLLTEEESALFSPQEQACVHKLFRNSCFCDTSRTGDYAAQKQEHIHRGLSCARLQMTDYFCRVLELAAVLVNRAFSLRVEHISRSLLKSRQFLLTFLCRRKEGLLHRFFACFSRIYSYNDFSLSKSTIISKEKVDCNGIYYDMQVLDTNNYICENGFIHHNSGKSQAGTYRLVKLLLEEKGLNVSHFFPSYRLAKRRGLPGVCEHLKNEYGLKYLINKSDLTVYVPEVNGTIYLESYHDPNSIVAYAIAHGVTDELDTLPKEQAAYVWQKITERVRQKCKRGNTLACVSTPDQGVNGFCYQKWGDGQHIDKGYHYIKAGTNSNKFLPEGYADQISKNYDPITAEAFLNGGWVSFTQNKVYHFFDRKKHHTARAITSGDTVLSIGIDFNIGGCCANVFIIENNNPVAVDEFVSYDTRDFISNLAARYRGKTCIIYPDASGAARKTNASQSDIELIKNAGYQVKVNHSNPAIRDRINIFNGLLAHDRLKINTDKCPLLTNALETQGYDKNGDPEKFDNHPAIDDFVDNSGYCLAYMFPIIRPVTQIRVGGGL